MEEALIITSCNEATVIPLGYDPLTQYLIGQYQMANEPQTKRIYDAWDYVITQLKSIISGITEILILEETDNFFLPDTRESKAVLSANTATINAAAGETEGGGYDLTADTVDGIAGMRYIRNDGGMWKGKAVIIF